MTTPAIMLVLLAGPYLLTRLLRQLTGRVVIHNQTAGCLGIALMFCFTALGHFVKTDEMVQMLPAWVPGRVSIIYATGILEFTAAAAVMLPGWRRFVGWGLIAMLLAFLPANIFAAIQRVDLGGHEWGPIYLLLRVPLQALIIAWIWWFAARSRSEI